MIFSCQISSKIEVLWEKETTLFLLKARPEKRPNIHESQCHRPQKEGVLLHNACLDVFLVPPEKRSWGNLLLLLGKGEFPPESHSIPFSPYFHVLCVCLYGSMLLEL